MRLEKNTYTFGITKVKGYSFLPGPIISEPYKKNYSVNFASLFPDNKILINLKTLPNRKKLQTIYFLTQVRNHTNHLPCFYPEELYAQNKNTSSCLCGPLLFVHLEQSMQP